MDYTCPICKKANQMATLMDRTVGTLQPTDGDINMCIGCGDWSIVEGDHLRRPTNAELEEIRTSDTCQTLVKGWLMMKMSEAQHVNKQR